MNHPLCPHKSSKNWTTKHTLNIKTEELLKCNKTMENNMAGSSLSPPQSITDCYQNGSMFPSRELLWGGGRRQEKSTTATNLLPTSTPLLISSQLHQIVSFLAFAPKATKRNQRGTSWKEKSTNDVYKVKACTHVHMSVFTKISEHLSWHYQSSWKNHLPHN